jgi:CheY-like chemotaxis protein
MRSAMRGGQLTQQLLAYARRQNLSPRPVDVNAVIVAMGELLQRSLGGLVQVETELAEDLWPATGDPTQIELVILNLAINSRDAMPQGGRLRIATSNEHLANPPRADAIDPGDYVRIAVIDTGSGMTRDVKERAFEPFFTTKEIGKGSGLGLAQVYGVAMQFGGTVRIVSEPGRGATVEVFLPRALVSQVSAVPAELHAAETPGTGGTVLIVDDDPDVREIAAIFLRDAGYTVREAGSGPEAREMLAAGPVSLALVDYAMPMMSGYEFVRVAREMQPSLPVIYVTGASDMLAPGRQPLEDPIVMKPYSRASLLKIVREQTLARSVAARLPDHSGNRP